ncbi:hypothetical protein VSR01_24065 [Actinacidiphila sp. DG2A-62]|jgi:hypothetical protein|uniref:hypothetical protein n=1 Tax=Actinacidiphila sp. DG2A-62 TaxID=3108821 RepID=UPI002DB5C0A9|nr:hypothetical protein [Actinacidiphila sp. DG2A-62]MEC3996419.1 hypothetical protein [Actinacidiphila sp. DG2A-62]
MTTPPIAFPDVEKLVVDILKSDPSLGAAEVSRDAPAGFDGTQSAVLVSRLGGTWVGDLYLDNPMMQLEVYGPDKASASILANAARHALLATLGGTYGGTTFTDVVEQDGPRWMPDYLYRAANRYVCVIKLALDVR